jgi:hypothetical protein
MSRDEAETGLARNGPNPEKTEYALREEGAGVLPLLELLEHSRTPGVAYRAKRIRTWVMLSLGDKVPHDLGEQLLDFPELEFQQAEATIERVGKIKPVPFQLLAALDSRLLEWSLTDWQKAHFRKSVAKIVATNITSFPDPATIRLDMIRSETRAMILNTLIASERGFTPQEYDRWLSGHEDSRNGFNPETLRMEIARLEKLGRREEIFGLYSSTPNRVILEWYFFHRDYAASLDIGKLKRMEIVGLLECSHYDGKPMQKYPAYKIARAAFPDIGKDLMPNTRFLEAAWLAENGRIREGFLLAMKLQSAAAGEFVGTWMREHPDTWTVRLPVGDNFSGVAMDGFLRGIAPLDRMTPPEEVESILAVFDHLAKEEEWLDHAWRHHHDRLYLLYMGRHGRLKEAVANYTSRFNGWKSRELDLLLAQNPGWIDQLQPATPKK